MHERSIILFDGVCNLCNGAVKFIIKRDKKKHFIFAALQSPEGRELLEQYDLRVTNINSFILIENRQVYTSSTGALRVTKNLNGFWPLLYALIIVPKFIRDQIYSLIAKNRYKWFGKKNSCMIPTEELRARFLS